MSAPAQARLPALVLPGGGARGAYQVGVLRALGEILEDQATPFPVITGISAGAINAGVMASYADDFRLGAERLAHFWGHLSCDQVYRTGWLHNLGTGLHWLAAMTLGGLGVANPKSLFDNQPLAELLERELRPEAIEACVASGALKALMITTSGYSTNRAITFFQADPRVPGWQLPRRIGQPAAIDHNHLLASTALPLLFPARRIGHEFHGDGGLRQTAPLGPALQMGADRLVIIGTRDEVQDPEPTRLQAYPGLGDIGGYLLDIIFMDHLSADLDRLERTNRMLEQWPGDCPPPEGLRRVDSVYIRPSQDLREVGQRHAHRIPASVKTLLRGIGAWGSGRMAGFLLFEAEFCRELMALGYRDGMAAEEQIRVLMGED
ncbi:patatin-like phospholipase family protein [Wenzhouxiangella marina]|uniref:Patatin n=1 Tax=Wenzhouxiangella marina TaxID=1579979 RepID=A0A0K0Y054_9GAMM|nr:patatin-like phospholipase family protein [Wenzhouxiangella marina]AKS43319.1 Patatin [Wenzhouxiangella marina]MBB6088566.1 NTE family protein [Wenzhouxiangella marina]